MKRKNFVTEISRVMSVRKNELKKFKKNAVISIDITGNNWGNLKSLSIYKDKFSGYILPDHFKNDDYILILSCNHAVVTMHDYKISNIVYYDEQEVHCSSNSKFMVKNISFENLEEDKTIYIDLVMLDQDVDLSKNDYSLYRIYDKLYNDFILN